MKKPRDGGYWILLIRDCANTRGFTMSSEWTTGNTYRRNGWRVAHPGAAIRYETSSMSMKTGSIVIDATGVTLAVTITQGNKVDRFVAGLRNLQEPPKLIEVGGTDVTDEVIRLLKIQ